jgi:hypothetical protein
MLRIQALEAAKREEYHCKGDYSLPEEGRRDFCRSRNPGN